MMSTINTCMKLEAAEAPLCIARQATEAGDAIATVGAALRDMDPPFVATIARGSSDHAATFSKYLIETATGTPVTSFAPSVSSVYQARSAMRNAVCITISQSGQSPDLVSATKAARADGALTIAVVNDVSSPLARVADYTLPLCASPETAVAATKSYLASLTMLCRIVASWTNDDGLGKALDDLPQAMEKAWQCDWSVAEPSFIKTNSLFVIGRGLGLGIAHEAALKFKETCRIHAEGYSAAEVLHGPAAVIREGFPILALVQDDATAIGTKDTCARLAEMGADVFVAGAEVSGCTSLPSIEFDARLQPILLAQTLYRFVNSCAVLRGENPDAPPNLMKVTETT